MTIEQYQEFIAKVNAAMETTDMTNLEESIKLTEYIRELKKEYGAENTDV